MGSTFTSSGAMVSLDGPPELRLGSCAGTRRSTFVVIEDLRCRRTPAGTKIIEGAMTSRVFRWRFQSRGGDRYRGPSFVWLGFARLTWEARLYCGSPRDSWRHAEGAEGC